MRLLFWEINVTIWTGNKTLPVEDMMEDDTTDKQFYLEKGREIRGQC